MKVRVCQHCHENPCECMTAREACLMFGPVFAGLCISTGGSVAIGADSHDPKVAMWTISLGVLPGFLVGMLLAFTFGDSNKD